jgi:hypothetical protein
VQAIPIQKEVSGIENFLKNLVPPAVTYMIDELKNVL